MFQLQREVATLAYLCAPMFSAQVIYFLCGDAIGPTAPNERLGEVFGHQPATAAAPVAFRPRPASSSPEKIAFLFQNFESVTSPATKAAFSFLRFIITIVVVVGPCARAKGCCECICSSFRICSYLPRGRKMGNHPSNHQPLERANVGKFGDPQTVGARGSFNGLTDN